MNTDRRAKVDMGITHSEGGWPKDISPNEPDMMLRHRKKLEKEDAYQTCLPQMFEVTDTIGSYLNSFGIN